MSRFIASSLFAACLATAGHAQIQPIAPFTGKYLEEFESATSGTACYPGRIFSKHGDVCTPLGNYCFDTFGWLLYCAIYAHNGSDGMFGSTQGPAVYTFDAPAQRFGGYFGTNGFLADGNAKFYDANDALIATLPITAPKCSWAWNGWDAGTGPKFKRIEVFANDPYNGGALLQMDDMQLDPVAPASANSTGTGCTGSNGKKPNLATTGLPSVGNSSFQLTLSGAITGQSGFLFLATGIAPSPYPVGANCNIYLDLASMNLLIMSGSSPVGPLPVAAGGTITLPAPIPADPSLYGLTVAVQGLATDPGLARGYVFSNARTLFLGL